MASQSGTAIYVHHGLNEQNVNYFKHVLAGALAVGETLTLTLPANVDKASLPLAAFVWSSATPALPGIIPFTATTLTVTSYNRTTGVLVLTVGAAGVPQDSIVIVQTLAVG